MSPSSRFVVRKAAHTVPTRFASVLGLSSRGLSNTSRPSFAGRQRWGSECPVSTLREGPGDPSCPCCGFTPVLLLGSRSAVVTVCPLVSRMRSCVCGLHGEGPGAVQRVHPWLHEGERPVCRSVRCLCCAAMEPSRAPRHDTHELTGRDPGLALFLQTPLPKGPKYLGVS